MFTGQDTAIRHPAQIPYADFFQSDYYGQGLLINVSKFALSSYFDVEFEVGRGVRVVHGAALEKRQWLRHLVRPDSIWCRPAQSKTNFVSGSATLCHWVLNSLSAKCRHTAQLIGEATIRWNVQYVNIWLIVHPRKAYIQAHTKSVKNLDV